DAEAVASVEGATFGSDVPFQYKKVDAIAGKGRLVSQCSFGAGVGVGEAGGLGVSDGVCLGAWADGGLPCVLAVVRVEGTRVMGGSDAWLLGEDPDLEEVGVIVMGSVVFGVADAAASTHDLYVAGVDDLFGTDTVLVGQGAFERDGDDLHVLVRL